MKGTRLFALAAGWAAAACALGQANIITQLTPGASPDALAVVFGIRYVDRTPEGPFALFQANSHEHAEQVQIAMRNHAQVVFAEDDDLMEVIENNNGKGSTVPQLRANPIETLFSFGSTYALNSHWLEQISWSYDAAPFDKDIRVAVLDTGLSFNQPTLWSRVVAAKSFNARETSADDARGPGAATHLYDPSGARGHGTMVAGIVAQIAPEANLIICRVARSDGTTSVWKLIRGISFAVANRAHIANLSMGALGDLPAMNNVLEWAQDHGMLVVAAAGNNAAHQMLSPANEQKCLCVTAVDPHDRKANFANWHPEVDMAAPGTGIASAWWTGQTAAWSGTSFAAPIVAGSIADALRFRATPMTADDLHEAVELVGDSIDAMNPQYANQLGRRLNHLRTRDAIVGYIP